MDRRLRFRRFASAFERTLLRRWVAQSCRVRRGVSSLLCIGQLSSLTLYVRSPQLLEANLSGLLSEASPADHKLVLSDETFLVGAASAGARVLSVFSGVRELLVGHLSTTSYLIIISQLLQNYSHLTLSSRQRLVTFYPLSVSFPPL